MKKSLEITWMKVAADFSRISTRKNDKIRKKLFTEEC